MQKVVVGFLGSGNVQVAEETTNPCSEDEEHDENEQSGTDAVHDSLEVTLVLSALDKSSSATDERVLSGGENDTVGLAALATSSVVDNVAHVLVDSERLTSDGGLIGSDDRVTLVLDTLSTLVVVVLGAGGVLLGVQSVLFAEFLVRGKVLRSIVVADKTGISGDGLTLFDDDDVAGNQFTCLDFLLLTVTDDNRLHGDVTLQTGDDVGSLLFLVPTDESVEKKNTDDNTEVDPRTQTSSEQDSDLHGVQDRSLEESEELEEQILLFGDDLVPAIALAAVFDIVFGDTLLDVGLEPIVGDVGVFKAGAG